MEREVKPILVWPFKYAPLEFKIFSPHGGDEDWVAFVPDMYRDMYISWLDSGGGFGCCYVSQHEVPGGTVYIGAHA